MRSTVRSIQQYNKVYEEYSKVYEEYSKVYPVVQ